MRRNFANASERSTLDPVMGWCCLRNIGTDLCQPTVSLGHKEFVDNDQSKRCVTNILRTLPTSCTRYHVLPRSDQNRCGRYHRPHSRQVTGARCTGGRGSPVMSWILLKANNAQQASGVGDKIFFRFKRNVQHLWTAIIRYHVNDIKHQQVMRFNQWS